MEIRKMVTFVEDTRSEATEAVEPVLRKVAVVAVVKNTFAARGIDRHPARLQGRAVRALALRRHEHHAARRTPCGRDCGDLLLRQPGSAAPPGWRSGR